MFAHFRVLKGAIADNLFHNQRDLILQATAQQGLFLSQAVAHPPEHQVEVHIHQAEVHLQVARAELQHAVRDLLEVALQEAAEVVHPVVLLQEAADNLVSFILVIY